MWTHYANENKGCCLEVEITSKTWERLEVQYEKYTPKLTNETIIRDILGVKVKTWEYEKEVRYLSPVDNKGKKHPQHSVKIHRITKISSLKMSIRPKKVIKAIIKIEKMKKEALNYGFRY